MGKFTKVASSDGSDYTFLSQKSNKWITVRSFKSNPYRMPPNYVPHHMKRMKLACKFFLGFKFPGFEPDKEKLVNIIQLLKNVQISESNSD